MERPEKHFHVYWACKALTRDNLPMRPNIYYAEELGYWSRADANLAASKRKGTAIVKQCALPGCRLKERWPDGGRYD